MVLVSISLPLLLLDEELRPKQNVLAGSFLLPGFRLRIGGGVGR